MSTIISKLPYRNFADRVPVPGLGSEVRIFPYQLMLWASITLSTEEKLHPDTPRFPVILRTGFGHVFFIQEDQLMTWAGLAPDVRERRGEVEIPIDLPDETQYVSSPILPMNVWLHTNRPGERDNLIPNSAFCLEMDPGIVVYPSGQPCPPRIPILGLRAFETEDIQLHVDCKALHISLYTRSLLSRLFGR